RAASQAPTLRRDSPLLSLLRTRFIAVPEEQGTVIHERPERLPRFLLVQRYRVLTAPEVLTALSDPQFSGRAEVLLESLPNPAPQISVNPGSVELVESSTDSSTVSVTLGAPAILLITDSYSRHWHATPVGENPQHEYQVLPGDYCLQAIPLA